MRNTIYVLLIGLFFGHFSASAQTLHKYATQGNQVDIQLIMNQNYTFSLYVLIPPDRQMYAQAFKDTVHYKGKWTSNQTDYVLTFTDKIPPFEILFDAEYTPQGAIKLLNERAFAFNKSKPYVLIWGEICQQTN